MLRKLVTVIALATTPAWAAQASAPFTGADYSGRYECTGQDKHIGSYKGVVDMALDAKQSTGKASKKASDKLPTLSDISKMTAEQQAELLADL